MSRGDTMAPAGLRTTFGQRYCMLRSDAVCFRRPATFMSSWRSQGEQFSFPECTRKCTRGSPAPKRWGVLLLHFAHERRFTKIDFFTQRVNPLVVE